MVNDLPKNIRITPEVKEEIERMGLFEKVKEFAVTLKENGFIEDSELLVSEDEIESPEETKEEESETAKRIRNLMLRKSNTQERHEQ